MERFGGIPAIVLGAAFLVALVLGNAAVAALLLVTLIAVVAIASMRQTARNRAADPVEELKPESRTIFIKARRLDSEIEEIAAAAEKGSAVGILGAEARQESRRILDQVAQSLRIRQELKKLLNGRSLLEKETGELQASLGAATSDAERAPLVNALEAKRLEAQHYAEIDATIAKIDLGVRQAEAALAEMKARLSAEATAGRAAQLPEDDLRETIGRMKAISLSVDEAQELLRTSGS